MDLAKKIAQRYAAFHPCMQGGPCQCGGGCGQQSLMMQPDYGSKEGDGESYMSVQALQSMRDHAEDLLSRVDHGTPLPDWAESKLTRAAQSLNDVYEYMSHGKGQRLAGLLRTAEGMPPEVQKANRMRNSRRGLSFSEAMGYIRQLGS